jgi:hypothetical protein
MVCKQDYGVMKLEENIIGLAWLPMYNSEMVKIREK